MSKSLMRLLRIPFQAANKDGARDQKSRSMTLRARSQASLAFPETVTSTRSRPYDLVGAMAFAPASAAKFSLLPADNATGNFTKIVQRIPLKIAIDDVDGLGDRLRAGMSVSAEIDTTEVTLYHSG
jgi:hypothetical protein